MLNMLKYKWQNPLANISNFAVNQPSLLEVECLNLLAEQLHFTYNNKFLKQFLIDTLIVLN